MAEPTSLRIIARRCIDENDTITLSCFSSQETTNWYGYCSEHVIGVVLEEAFGTTPEDKGRCIAEAVQDRDLEVAFTHLYYLNRANRYNAKYRLEHDFMVVLVHEIKVELNERKTALHA